jgi:hypothetical protein
MMEKVSFKLLGVIHQYNTYLADDVFVLTIAL